MTPRTSSQSGITLAELLITSVMVGMVMVGVLSVEYALRNMQKSSINNSQISMDASSVMLSITRDAMLMVGDASNPGYRHDLSETTWICFRQDDDGTPSNYGDDAWACYSRDGNNMLSRCVQASPQACLSGEDMLQLSASDFFEVMDDSGSLDYVAVDLAVLADPSQASHPINNPEVRVSSRIRPIGQSSN